jgi:hypothetical protein
MAAGQVNGAAIIDLPLLKSEQDAAKRNFRLTTTAHTCRPCRARGCVCVCVCACACEGVCMEESACVVCPV